MADTIRATTPISRSVSTRSSSSRSAHPLARWRSFHWRRRVSALKASGAHVTVIQPDKASEDAVDLRKPRESGHPHADRKGGVRTGKARGRWGPGSGYNSRSMLASLATGAPDADEILEPLPRLRRRARARASIPRRKRRSSSSSRASTSSSTRRPARASRWWRPRCTSRRSPRASARFYTCPIKALVNEKFFALCDDVRRRQRRA